MRYGKNAKHSLEAASASNLIKDHTRNEDLNSRRPTHPTLTTNTAVDRVSADGSLELEPRSRRPEQHTRTSSLVIKVLRPWRRGLLARISILAEIEDPYQYPYRTK